MDAIVNFRIRSLLNCASFLLLAAGPIAKSDAALMTRDLFSAGDSYLTFDSESKYEWLYLPLTKNYSYGEILNGTGGWVGRGFRYATSDEVRNLFEQACRADGNGCDPVTLWAKRKTPSLQ